MLTKKGERTRDRILDATAALAVERGAANTCLDDIRAATGTSKSQLFHYFPEGKAELFATVEQREARRILDDQRPALDALDSWEAWDEWRELVTALYHRKLDGCPLAALNGYTLDFDPEAPDPVVGLYAEWLGAMARGLASMQAAGTLSPDVDPNDLATVTLATIQGGVLIMQATGATCPFDLALDAAIAGVRHHATDT